MLKDLITEFKGTNIIYERMDLMNLNMEELNSMLKKMKLNMKYIDLFINGWEILLDKDLQTSMDLNMVSFEYCSFSDKYLKCLISAEPLLEHDFDGA